MRYPEEMHCKVRRLNASARKKGAARRPAARHQAHDQAQQLLHGQRQDADGHRAGHDRACDPKLCGSSARTAGSARSGPTRPWPILGWSSARARRAGDGARGHCLHSGAAARPVGAHGQGRHRGHDARKGPQLPDLRAGWRSTSARAGTTRASARRCARPTPPRSARRRPCSGWCRPRRTRRTRRCATRPSWPFRRASTTR